MTRTSSKQATEAALGLADLLLARPRRRRRRRSILVLVLVLVLVLALLFATTDLTHA